ncbi:MAG: permease [Geminicoccaceae bacterium]
MARDSHAGEAIAFFFYDVPKVLLLLAGIVFVTGVLRSWFSPEKTRAILAGKREIWGYPLASLLGVLTPFCSCSSVPLFIGFVSAGIPLGVTFSFLIAGPMVGRGARLALRPRRLADRDLRLRFPSPPSREWSSVGWGWNAICGTGCAS